MKPSGQHEAPFGNKDGDAVHADEYTCNVEATGTKRSPNNSVNTLQVGKHGVSGGSGLKGDDSVNAGYKDNHGKMSY